MGEVINMLSYETFSDDNGTMMVSHDCEPAWMEPCSPDYGGICKPTENDFDCSPYKKIFCCI